MFPIPFNFPFIKKNGERTTIGDAIGEGGGGSPYTLPTASANTKGGVKIGAGLTMTGDVLSATESSSVPYYDSMLYKVGTHDGFDYFCEMIKRLAGEYEGYEIETTSIDAYGAKIKVYSVDYNDGALTKTLLKELTHDGDKTYSDDVISVTYSSDWIVTFTDTLIDETGTAYTSPLKWAYNKEVDYILLIIEE